MSKFATQDNNNETRAFDKSELVSLNTGGDPRVNSDGGELSNFEDLTVCPLCGYQNLAGSNFCIVCGSRMNRPTQNPHAPFAELSSDRESVNMFRDENRETHSLSGAVSDTEGGNHRTVPAEVSNAAADCEGTEERSVPTLTRIKNNEKTVIGKPLFKIGTSRDSCDMVIADNRYISRIHAYVVTRAGCYFIIDRNSTNKTYVDGKEIPAETEVELFDNTPVRLANEDMMFNIEQA